MDVKDTDQVVDLLKTILQEEERRQKLAESEEKVVNRSWRNVVAVEQQLAEGEQQVTTTFLQQRLLNLEQSKLNLEQKERNFKPSVDP